MKPTTEITLFKIDLDPQLPEVRRETILNGYLPIYRQIQDVEQEVTAITQSETTVYTTAIAKKARQVRLKLVALRGKDGLKGVHDELKLGAKLEGQAIDYLEREPRETLLEWEEKLREIEEFPAREEARRIAELQELRLADLQGYVLNEADPALTTLGELSDEKWEEVFTHYRNIWNDEQERIRKAALRRDRIEKAAPYSLYIEEFDAIAWESLTEKQFDKTVAEAKTAHEEREAEAERLKQQLEKERKEAEAKAAAIKAEAEAKAAAEKAAAEIKAATLRKRTARLLGCSQEEDGIYYGAKKILTYKSIEDWDDEKFENFLTLHLETYEADEAKKKAIAEAERQAAIEKAAAQARIDEQIRLQKEAEEKARKEAAEKEAEIARKKKEAEEKARLAQGEPDSAKLRNLATAFAAVQVPVCREEKGIATVAKFKEVQEKWVAGLNRLANELKEEMF